MKVPFLDLSRQVAGLREELDEAIAAILEGGRFVGGDPVARFEREFAAYCGAAEAVGVASGTDAITLALRAVGVGPGDEVVTVANTCVPTVAGIEATGATPVVVDPSPETMTMDAERVAAAVTPRTRAVVPVHLYGRCAEMDPILALAAEHDLRVVEDCAQAHGASDRSRRAGSMGDAAAFSFYPTKNLGALGDGGAVVTTDPTVARRARMLGSYGEERRYESILRGTNSRLDSLQAAILSTKLRHLEVWIARRRAIAAHYRSALEDAGLEPPDDPADGNHVFHLYVVRVEERDAFRSALLGLGVETLVHYPKAIHEHPAYSNVARAGDLAASARLAASVVSLPLFPELTDDEVEHVAAALRGGTHRA